MMPKLRAGWYVLMMALCCAMSTQAQEGIAPLKANNALLNARAATTCGHFNAKATAASGLPFFEDFTDYALYPNPARWTDSEVYINNTMGVQPISRGVATFDALDKRGRPYDTINRFASLYADSLTSQAFDFAGYSVSDNIYLSFFYQPQGAGFSPETGDSLMLFFHRRSGGWAQIWATPGTDLRPFQQVIVPVADTSFFYDGFQFRFVNKASINSNDDVWNVDYIRMDVNRSPGDTAVRDLAFTSDPSFLLNDYTSMPYRQFLANAGGERAATMSDTIWNHYGTNSTVSYGYNAFEATTGTTLSSAASTVNIPLYSLRGVLFPIYTATVAPPSNTSRIVYRNTWFLQSGNPQEPKANDSIVRDQVFDNYLAYDDGTAEKSYFLNLAQSLPGKTAIEFHLNVPDTLRGMAIYFGQQVPSGAGKEFSAAVYTALGGISGANADKKIFEQNGLLPLYTDEANRFTVYRFDIPIPLDKGVFYLGTTQPASSGSDSLYIGLDANRVGGNHLYYNVLNAWQPSLVSGALMIRPLLGGPVTGTGVAAELTRWLPEWKPVPNPATTTLNIQGTTPKEWSIADMQGRVVREGIGATVQISDLSAGIYLLRIRETVGAAWSLPQKFIKQ